MASDLVETIDHQSISSIAGSDHGDTIINNISYELLSFSKLILKFI